MQKIEVINGATIEVDGQKYHREESVSNLLRETNGYFHIGDEITVKNTGNQCSTHPEREKYKGWKDFPYFDVTKPATILVFKRLNYPDACIVKQGMGIYIFSGTESFTLYKPIVKRPKKSIPSTIEELEIFLNDYNKSGKGNTIPNFLENYEE
jgi:hypothetical protein